MSVGHSSGTTPSPRIGEDDTLGSPRVNVYTTRDGGIMLSGQLENADGTTLRDPKDNDKAFQFQIGIEDWTVALMLGASLVEAAMYQRARILQDIEHDERQERREKETSALYNPPQGEEPVL